MAAVATLVAEGNAPTRAYFPAKNGVNLETRQDDGGALRRRYIATRRLHRLVPDPADADVGFGAEVEPGGLAARGVDHEQGIELAQFLDQTIAYRADRLLGGKNPDRRHQLVGRAERHDRLLEISGRTRFQVDDDRELCAAVFGL